MAPDGKKAFRFGVFEANSSSGELRKSGTRLRLQDQAFHVLLMLLENSGQVVSREQLRQKLWPADTFVDFDHSLNTLVNKLREVLGDSAANPRFIETLAKRGYRFLPPVEVIPTQPCYLPTAVADDPAAMSTEDLPESGSFLTHRQELPVVPAEYPRLLFVLIQIMYLSFYLIGLARLPIAEELLGQAFGRPAWSTAVMIVSAAIGIPLRLYLLSYVAFDVKDLARKFLWLFPGMFLLDQLWALAPFLLVPQIGMGLALGVTAALIYVPFAQRTLVLMRESFKFRHGLKSSCQNATAKVSAT